MCESADRNEEKDMAMTLVGVPFFPCLTGWQRVPVNAAFTDRLKQTKINKNFPKTNNLSVSDTHTCYSFNSGEPSNLVSLKQRSHLNYNGDIKHRSAIRKTMGILIDWEKPVQRTTPLQITAAIYFYTTNEAVRNRLHCQADPWIPMRSPIVSR